MGKNITKTLRTLQAVPIAATVLFCILFITSAYAGKINPVESAKYAIFGMLFPLCLAGTALLLVVWAIFRKWKIALIPLVSLILCASPIFTYFPVNFTRHDAAADTSKSSFTLLTFNVMNFDDMDGRNDTPNRTVQYILDTDADIVCLQEGSVYDTLKHNKIVSHMYSQIKAKYKYVFDGPHDLIILSKFPYQIADTEITTNAPVKSMAYKVNVNGRVINIINVHLQSIGLTESDKNLYREITQLNEINTIDGIRDVKGSLLSKLAFAFKQRASQAQDLRKYIDSCSENVILCGDFNDTPSSFAYHTIMGNDMSDAYADCAFGPTITYHANRFFFKIDHVLYKGSFKAVNIIRGKFNASDHYPLLTTFQWDE